MGKVKDNVAAENRRALPKFLGILLLSALVGAGVGLLVMAVGFSGLAEAVQQGLGQLWTALAPWGIPGSSLLFLGIGFGLYRSAHKQFLSWDGEAEEIGDQVERRLNGVLLCTFLANVLDFFFLSVGLFYNGGLLVVAEMLVSLALVFMLQQRVVDQVRRMNPEKQGSIYEAKFQKKWMESCDEAERAQIGQAATRAYRTVHFTCIWLWVVLLVLSLVFDIGLLPSALVLFIWAILQISYILECFRMSRGVKQRELADQNN